MIANFSTWAPATAYANSGAKGDYVRPTEGRATAFLYRCIVAGTSGANEPAWPVQLAGQVVDNTATWACAGMAPLFELFDFEDRIGRQTVEAILGDDNDGYVKREAFLRLAFDATSYVVGLIGGAYDFPIGSPFPNELQRIALDVATGYAYLRKPEVARFDGGILLERARKDLKDLKDGISQLDIPLLGVTQANPPGPAPAAPVAPVPANVGGFVVDGAHRLVISSPDGTENGGDF